MTAVSPPDPAASPEEAGEEQPLGPQVVVAITNVAGVDSQPTVEAVRRQTFRPLSVTLVGGDTDAPDGVVLSADLVQLVASLDPAVDYVWILHGDAAPRPDALAALVDEAERHEASLAGSKLLVGGTKDTLEGIGSATDIFGEPYSGLDEGEVDLEQYDVVRDVAFVNSVSMLVRRDLLRGLRGLDQALAPVAAGLDLSQRVRIAGGRVMVVPSSEVFHMGRCGRGDGGWREQSGRMRAMLKAYRPVTLVWMVPFAIVTGVLDSLASLVLGRWRIVPRYLLTWAWNLVHLPSTLAGRRVLARVRQVGDEELYRYQVRGSVRLRQVGSEMSERLLGIFDEDRALSRRASEAWNSSGAWAVVAALLLVLVGLRTVFVGPLPSVGHALPLGEEPSIALARMLGGWNAAGLGSDAPVHPSVGPAALVQVLLLGHGVIARSLITIAAFIAGVLGVGRLAGRLRVGGAGAYLGGVAAMFGLPAAILAGGGRWSALIGLGALPWALLVVVGPPLGSRRQWLGAWGRATLAVGATALFLPVLAIAPFLFALAIRVVGRFPSRLGVAASGSVGAVAAIPYLAGRADAFTSGPSLVVEMPAAAVLALVVATLAGMVAGSWRVGALGGSLAFGGLALAGVAGPELQVGLLALAAVGVGLAVAAALRRRPTMGPVQWLSMAGGVAVFVVSLAGLSGGRAGLPADDWGATLRFVGLEPDGVERALLVASDPNRLPGEARPGAGFWYRLVTSAGPTLDQVTLPEPGPGDDALRAALATIAEGGSLEPGALLAPFGVRWLVAVGDSATDLVPILDAQIDLDPVPVSDGVAVYENTVVRSVAETDEGTVWERAGTGFAGEATTERVRLAVQGDSRWRPDWQALDWAGTVAGEDGMTSFSGSNATRLTVLAGALALIAGLGAVAWARRERL